MSCAVAVSFIMMLCLLCTCSLWFFTGQISAKLVWIFGECKLATVLFVYIEVLHHDMNGPLRTWFSS